MGVVLRYVRINKAGRYEFRRGVPERLRQIVGSREIKKVLADTEAKAVAIYPCVRAEADKVLEAAERALKASPSSSDTATPTELEAYERASQRFRELVPPGADDGYREVLVDGLLRGYPVDPQSGDPMGVSDDTRQLVNLVRGADAKPEPTLADAKRLYLEERLDGGEGDAKKDAQRLERVFGRVKDTLGEYPALSSLTYGHARKVRDHMLTVNGLAPSSVKRELNFVKAALSLWQRTHPQDTVHNPFAGLEYGRKVEAMSNKRSRAALPPKVLKEARAVVLSSANPEARLVWRLLEGTGCRLAEVTGLRVEDVVVTGDLPHIVVTWHEDRRVKGQASVRRVPLIGDALRAAQEALQLHREGHMVFPRYGRKGGPTAASKVLNNKLDKVTLKDEHVVHSLRHNMKGLLVTAGVDELVQNVILGHSLGGVGNRHYLGDDAKLRAAQVAMKKALREEVDQ